MWPMHDRFQPFSVKNEKLLLSNCSQKRLVIMPKKSAADLFCFVGETNMFVITRYLPKYSR